MLDFRDFMDISYSLLMEDHARVSPLEGFEQLSQKIVPAGRQMEQVPRKEDVAAQNQQSMAALQAMMSGVQRKPRMGK